MSRHDAPTVLIADADPRSSSALADGLEATGYRVVQTRDGRRAAHLAHRRRPDVVVLDLELPGRPGLEVLDGLKRRHETCLTPVVVVSASAPLLLPHEARRAAAVLAKPCPVADVLAAVGGALRRRGSAGSSAGSVPAR